MNDIENANILGKNEEIKKLQAELETENNLNIFNLKLKENKVKILESNLEKK